MEKKKGETGLKANTWDEDVLFCPFLVGRGAADSPLAKACFAVPRNARSLDLIIGVCWPGGKEATGPVSTIVSVVVKNEANTTGGEATNVVRTTSQSTQQETRGEMGYGVPLLVIQQRQPCHGSGDREEQ